LSKAGGYQAATFFAILYSVIVIISFCRYMVLNIGSDDKDHYMTKSISEYREALFAAMLNKHYTHAALYMKCMIECVPSRINLEAIEAPEPNLSPNENATDYAKRLFKWIDSTLPKIERRIADAI
jgi:hypothetical protein